MNTYLSLGSPEAKVATEAILEEARQRNLAAVIAVADAFGELLSLVRMDNALLASLAIASNKAWTAARDRRRTEEVGRAAKDSVQGFDIAYYADPRYVGWAGGIPVLLDSHVIGSVAVSGLTEELDAVLAEIGVAAILASLRATEGPPSEQ